MVKQSYSHSKSAAEWDNRTLTQYLYPNQIQILLSRPIVLLIQQMCAFKVSMSPKMHVKYLMQTIFLETRMWGV